MAKEFAYRQNGNEDAEWKSDNMSLSVADPGFPVGGVHPLGGVDLRHGCFLVKMYAKMKELGPTGGGVCPACPLDPPMLILWVKYSLYPMKMFQYITLNSYITKFLDM